MSKSLSLVELGRHYIVNNKVDQLTALINRMPVNKLQPDVARKLLIKFLKTCQEYNRPSIVNILLTRWSEYLPEMETVSLKTQLFMDRQMNEYTSDGVNDIMTFVALSDPSYTFGEAIVEMCQWDNSPEILYACQRAYDIFKPHSQDQKILNLLADQATFFKNDRVKDFLDEKIMISAPYAVVPDFVDNFIDGPVPEVVAPPEIEAPPFVMPPVDQAVQMLTEGLSFKGQSEVEQRQTIERVEKALINDVPEAERLVEKAYHQEFQAGLAKNKNLFRLYGPANPFVDQDLTVGTPSSVYGGCRMFLYQLNNWDEEYQMYLDWFDGACDQCLKRIRVRWHAVRRPLPHGGWVGTYCSWKCVFDELDQGVQAEGAESAEGPIQPDILTRQLTILYEKLTKANGIQDRTSDETGVPDKSIYDIGI